MSSVMKFPSMSMSSKSDKAPKAESMAEETKEAPPADQVAEPVADTSPAGEAAAPEAAADEAVKKEEAPEEEFKMGKEAMTEFKAAMKEKRGISKGWMALSAAAVISVAVGALQLVWLVLKLAWTTVKSWRTVISLVFWILFPVWFVSRHILLPVAVILGNLWLFRDVVIKLAVKFLKAKKGIVVREIKVDGSASLKKSEEGTRKLGLSLGNFGISTPEDPDELLEFKTLKVDVTEKAMKLDAQVVLDGLEVNLVTYDMQFKDTNLSRFLASLQGEDDESQKQEEPPKKEEEKPADKKDEKKGEERLTWGVTLTNVKIIAKHSSKQFGLRSLGAPMTIDKEVLKTETINSKTKLIIWLNKFIIKQVVSGGFNIATSAVDGVGTLVTSGVGAVLGGVDSAASYVPGGSVIKGATGGTRKIVGGTFSGVSKVTHGVAGGGKAIVGGITSGSVEGMKEGFYKASSSVGDGFAGAASDVGGGLAGAASDVASGAEKAAAGAGTVTGVAPKQETKTPEKKKGGGFSMFKSSKSSKSPAK